MTIFQIAALFVLGVLLFREIVTWSQPSLSRSFKLVRALILVCAAMTIAEPELTQIVARFLGIGRGADVVLYLSVFAFLGISFYLYARCLRLERDITLLTRHLAMRDAVKTAYLDRLTGVTIP